MSDLLLFDFSNQPILHLSLLPAIFNSALAIYIYCRHGANRLNNSLLLLLSLMIFWQMLEFLTRTAHSRAAFEIWHRISSSMILLLLPAALYFIQTYTGWKRGALNKFLMFYSFAPAFLFVPLSLVGFNKFEIITSGTWGWVANPAPSSANKFLFGWTFSCCIIAVAYLFAFLLRNRHLETRRNQALLLLTAFLLPISGGVIFEVVSPYVFQVDDVPVTSFLITGFSFLAFLAVKKYDLLHYSPHSKWEHILSQMSEGLVIIDNDEKIQYANPKFCDLLAYSLHELEGKQLHSLLNKPEFITPAMRARGRSSNARCQLQLKSRNGDLVWVQISGMPYRNSRGAIIGSIAIFTDITSLKLQEAATEHSRFRLKQAQALTGTGNWELNLRTKKVICSEEMYRIFGLDLSDPQATDLDTWLALVHPDDLGIVESELAKAGESMSKLEVKYRILRKDGSLRYIISAAEFEMGLFGNKENMIGVSVDVTEETLTRSALIESESRSRHFIEDSPLAICYIDPLTKKVLYSNDSFCSLLGYSRSEIPHLTVTDFVSDDPLKIDYAISTAINNGSLRNRETIWRKKNGAAINVLMNGFYHNGRQDLLYVEAQDITENKRNAWELKRKNEELKLFIYKLGHDIRGPVASMIGLSELAGTELKEPEALTYIKMLESAARGLDEKLGRLIISTQIQDEDKFGDEISFTSLISGILKKLNHSAAFSEVNISVNDQLHGFMSNTLLLETMLQNLIENAVKYRRTTSENCFVNIEITERNNQVLLTVSDNGIGISPEIQPKIFDMFFRGTAQRSGSGLGLYIVKKAVEQLHGTIRLTSAPGQGSRFSITLPKSPVLD